MTYFEVLQWYEQFRVPPLSLGPTITHSYLISNSYDIIYFIFMMSAPPCLKVWMCTGRAQGYYTTIHTGKCYWNSPFVLSALSWLVVLPGLACVVIGIDHDTVCAGVVGTAIRHSSSCTGRRVAVLAGTTSAVPDSSTNYDSADRISGQFLFYHDHHFIKSKENFRFWRLVPLFVPIGVCITTHDGTASDITIGMWRHNQQATTHERNGEPWFWPPK